MKRKLIFGALVLISILPLTQGLGNSDISEIVPAKFFGKSCTEEMIQPNRTNANSLKEGIITPQTTHYCCYYVFWVKVNCDWVTLEK